MKSTHRHMLGLMLAAACIAGPVAAQDASDPAAIHQSILTLDTHLDSPANLDQPVWRITDRHDVLHDTTQVLSLIHI